MSERPIMNESGKPDLDAGTIKALWSKPYNPPGKPDWSPSYPYYHPDIVVQDSIQRVEGIDEFVGLCSRLTERCRELRMDVHAVAKDGNVIFLQWTMTMMFKKFPSTPVYGSTVIRLHDDGRIISQRDYYDLWGDIFNGIPWFRARYRKFMGKHFG